MFLSVPDQQIGLRQKHPLEMQPKQIFWASVSSVNGRARKQHPEKIAFEVYGGRDALPSSTDEPEAPKKILSVP
jgi:hypothetical protein